MLSPAVNTVASGYASSRSAVASSLVRSQRAMLPAPMSCTACGEAVMAAETGVGVTGAVCGWGGAVGDRKSTRLNSSHSQISYAVFCLKKKKKRGNVRDGLREVSGPGRGLRVRG